MTLNGRSFLYFLIGFGLVLTPASGIKSWRRQRLRHSRKANSRLNRRVVRLQDRTRR